MQVGVAQRGCREGFEPFAHQGQHFFALFVVVELVIASLE